MSTCPHCDDIDFVVNDLEKALEHWAAFGDEDQTRFITVKVRSAQRRLKTLRDEESLNHARIVLSSLL
jgi:hypothetical protein